ncbi:MAG: carbamoyltransferase HypF [Bdellovibrio sp.]
MKDIERFNILITGTVQGVGFRPFIYNLAREHQIMGWVNNNLEGVSIDAEGASQQLKKFLEAIPLKKPSLAKIENIKHTIEAPIGYNSFLITESETASTHSHALVLPDTATCEMCLQDLFNPANRRYLYPFTTCTLCGPRFSISEKIPFDREHTAMNRFMMCSHCQNEYENPDDRRFYSQTNSCHDCGPKLFFLDQHGLKLAEENNALELACEKIKNGFIVAIKGIGGFHLFADARNDQAVENLRKRKKRAYKPFALMVSHLSEIEHLCFVSPEEQQALSSHLAPIVLLQRKKLLPNENKFVSELVAPNINLYGIMLPYTPVHHLLMQKLQFPLVATSANIADEPICTDEALDLEELKGLADFFLTHNRIIHNGLDDSVVRIIDNHSTVFRTGRGNSPGNLSLMSASQSKNVVLGVGGHLKNTVSVLKGNKIFLSQHNGSLETYEAVKKFQNQCEKFPAYHQAVPTVVVHDKHPQYASTFYACELAASNKLLLHGVQHHQAHILSCVAEHNLKFPLLGVCWDGTGFGLDNTYWGGEFLLMRSAHDFERLACLEPFHLPGAEYAIREPRRSLLGILYNCAPDSVTKLLKDKFSMRELETLIKMLDKKINSPVCSSAGRLFDAAASLLNICDFNNFEGEAAIRLEDTACDFLVGRSYEQTMKFFNQDLQGFIFKTNLLKNERDALTPSYHVLSSKIIKLLLEDIQCGKDNNYVAFRFHSALAKSIEEVAKVSGMETIVLTGGVFQNKLLSELALGLLRNAGLRPVMNREVPPNDGGLSVGQAYFMAQSDFVYGIEN